MAKQSSDAAHLCPAVLLTRPAALSQRFARALSDRFGDRVKPLLSPLMEPVFHRPDLPAMPFMAVIFTSETAVEAARRLRLGGQTLPATAYCVGHRTARAASAAGFAATSADGDARTLASLIIAAAPPGPMLYLHGRDTRGDLAGKLISAGIETVSALVYQQDTLPLSPDALARMAQPVPILVPLFSPRSADLLAASLPAVTAPLYLAAISPAVARHAAPIPHQRLHVAARPDAEAMLDTLEDLLILAQTP